MKISVIFEDKETIFELYNFIYWNQRFFCLGMHSNGEIVKRFISTKGFDQILIESDEGVRFHFTKEHFNPYLCSREKVIWRESQLIEKNEKDLLIEDIGPNNYSGTYAVCSNLGIYRDDIYFETKLFEEPKFDLYKYQSDDLYYTINQSKNRDSLPNIINLIDANVFNWLNIIHGVSEDGTKDYFDFESITQTCNADMSYPNENAFYKLVRATGYKDFLHITKIGALEFLKWDEIKNFENDCGNSYIRQNLRVAGFSKKKHCFRYLYEYFNNIHGLMSVRRKQSIQTVTGPKEFKKDDFIPIFYMDNMQEFSIVYFQDVWTIEKKTSISRLVNGDPIFRVSGYYDYINGCVKFDEFESKYELIRYVKENIGVTQSIRLGKVFAVWFSDTFGYTPRVIKLEMTPKANSKPLVKELNLYSVATIEENEVFTTNTYVNLFQLLACFGIHITQIRNLLTMNEFSDKIFRSIDISFRVYHVCRDIRRPIFDWDSDANLDSCMIDLKDALILIKLFESIGPKKNSYWYSNANKLYQSFPDTTLDTVSSNYQPPELSVYVENRD